MRLIDADAFDKCLENAEAEAIHMRKHVFASAVNVIRGNLKAFPTIEPERKRGKWITVNDAYNRISGKCSVCGWEAHMYEDDVVGMDYCPNCGASMEEGETE